MGWGILLIFINKDPYKSKDMSHPVREEGKKGKQGTYKWKCEFNHVLRCGYLLGSVSEHSHQSSRYDPAMDIRRSGIIWMSARWGHSTTADCFQSISLFFLFLFVLFFVCEKQGYESLRRVQVLSVADHTNWRYEPRCILKCNRWMSSIFWEE